MKKIFSLIVLLAGVMAITSCQDEMASYQVIQPLEITSADVLFESEGGNGSIVVNTSNALTATTDADWLTCTVSGNQVLVTCDPNVKLDGRSAAIKLRSGSNEAEVIATQKSSVFGFVDGTEYQIADYKGAVNINVVHNMPVTIESDATWFTAVFNEETNQIEVVAQDNDDESPREGTITVTMGEYTETLTIVQQGFLLNLSQTNLKATKSGAAEKFTVDVEHSRAVSVKSQSSWITTSWSSSSNRITINVAANTGGPRAGHVTVTSGPVTKDITVVQYIFDDLMGDYYLFFTQTYDSEDYYYVMSTLSDETLDFALYTRYPWSIPVTWDTANAAVSVTTGSYVGRYSSYYMYLMFMAMNAGKWSAWNVGYTMTAALDVYEDEDGYLLAKGDFEGAFGGYQADGWNFQALNAQEFDSGNSLGYLSRIYNTSLMTVLAAPETEADASAAKPAKAKKAVKLDSKTPLMLMR